MTGQTEIAIKNAARSDCRRDNQTSPLLSDTLLRFQGFPWPDGILSPASKFKVFLKVFFQWNLPGKA